MNDVREQRKRAWDFSRARFRVLVAVFVAVAVVVTAADSPRLAFAVDAVSASIASPTCDGDVVVTIRNQTYRPISFELFGDNRVPLMAPVVVGPHQSHSTITYKMRKAVESISVDGLGRQLASRKVGRPDPCLVEDAIDWGEPVRQDDFSSDSLDRKMWSIYDSPDAKQHPRTPDAVSVEDGQLQIAGGIYDIPSGRRDVSGGVSQNFGQMHGRWEARIRGDRGEGYAPVVLLWPDSEKWPDDGEIDVIEIAGADRQVGASFLHNGPNDDKVQRSQYFDWTQWHTVSVEWLANRITVAVDGIDQWHVIDPKYIPSTSPMHLTLQHDQGTAFSPPRNASTPDRVRMYVDWIKVYSLPENRR